MGISTINNHILIGLLAVIMALVSAGAVEFEARPVSGMNMVVAPCRDRRKVNTVSGMASAVHVVPPMGENPLERALREANHIEDNSATVVMVNGTGILFGHASGVYDALRELLGRIGPGVRIEASGISQRTGSLPYEFAGLNVRDCIAGPASVRLENVDMAGYRDEYSDVVVTGDKVEEMPREIEVPMPGYCMRCQAQVYRTGVELVYVPRVGYYHSGLDTCLRGTESRGADPYYMPATVGGCAFCGGNTMTFGADLTRTVLSSEFVDGDVPQRPEPVRAPVPRRSRLLHSVGYCMRCRMNVSRKDVRLVTLNNGTKATVGTCPKADCGVAVYRTGGRIDLDVIRKMDAITQTGYAFAYLMPRFVDKRFAWGRDNMDCDFPGCFGFAAWRGFRMQRVPGRKRGLVHTQPAAFCEGHNRQIQERYQEADVRAA